MATNDQGNFTVIDYGIFTLMLVLSSLIGIYYGFFAKTKQNTTDEYLFGGKQMTLLPISISLIVTHISGITMVGVPTEIYAFGAQIWLSFIPLILVGLSLQYIFCPIFFELKLLSTFMYLEKRFNRKLRLVVSAIFVLNIIFSCSIFVFAPALAFSQVSGVNIHYITSTLCIICVFYTTIGGLRAVVWTDTVQFVLMIGAVFAVIILGIIKNKYPMDIFSIADDGGRMILFDTNPSPLVRTSIWTVIVGMTFYYGGIGPSQSCIQKLLSLPDIKLAKQAIWIFMAGYIFFTLTAIILGIIIYTNYHDCDPFTAGTIKKLDQIVPHFVMQIGSQIPGLPGLFIAGLFSGGLSSMSGVLNVLSCIIYDDFLRNRLQNSSEKTISTILKLIVLIAGVLILGLVFVIEKLSTIYELSMRVFGTSMGAILGVFLVGMLCRQVNTKGAVSGAIASVLLVSIISFGSKGNPHSNTLPMRTDGCEAIVANWTMPSNIEIPFLPDATPNEEVFWLFRISFMYLSMIGCLTVFMVSYPISLLTQANEVIDETLLAPFLRMKKDVIDMNAVPKLEEIKKI